MLVLGIGWWVLPLSAPIPHDLAPDRPTNTALVGEDLVRREYRFIERSAGTFSAPNRAGGFRLSVTSEGLHLEPREKLQTSEAAWGLSLSLERISRGSVSRNDMDRGRQVRSVGDRAEIHREILTEWYENTADGLEQGFTLNKRPEGDGELMFVLRARGLMPVPSRRGVRFEHRGVGVLRYEKLLVHDADGREVPSRMALDGEHVLLAMRDDGAAYPLVIDPLITGYEWWTDGDLQAGAEYGTAVEIVGDVNNDGYPDVMVGAPKFDGVIMDVGRVYLYLGMATGLPHTPTLAISGDTRDGLFGTSIVPVGDINGDGFDDVVVGAPGLPTDPSYGGKIYLFHGSSTGLTMTPAWSHAELQAEHSTAFLWPMLGTSTRTLPLNSLWAHQHMMTAPTWTRGESTFIPHPLEYSRCPAGSVVGAPNLKRERSLVILWQALEVSMEWIRIPTLTTICCGRPVP